MVLGAAYGNRADHRFKQFPPGRAGVLLPSGHRRTAALGICLYTASRPTVLHIQQLAFCLTRLLGTRALPGVPKRWSPELDQWDDLLSTWQKEIGRFDSFAVYHRRQASRTGLTMLLVNDGIPLAVTKIRDEAEALHIEQRALDAVRRTNAKTFRVPEALGVAPFGDGLTWSAQTAVFGAPHRPVFTAPTSLFEEVSGALASVAGASPGRSAAHNDLTPWNLRVDRRGQRWLFDWEDVGTAPPESDRCYFCATSFALRGTAMPDDLPLETIEYWSQIISARSSGLGSDVRLRASILDGLDIARRSHPKQELIVDAAP